MEDEEDAPATQSRAAFVTRFVNQVHLYRKLLQKYWWIPVICIGAGLGIESQLLKRVPPTFVSVGRMIVNARLSLPNANVYNEELVYFFGTQVALMKSDSVVSRVQEHLKTKKPELAVVPMAIEVTVSPKTSIYDLRAVGGDAGYAQAYLQATMEEYIKLKKALLASTTTATQSTMEEQLREMEAQLEKSKQDILDFQASNSVVLLQPNGGNNASAHLLKLNQQLEELNSQLLLLKTQTLDENLEQMRRDSPASNSSSNSLSSGVQSGQVQLPGGDTAIPANLGGFEDAYLLTKQQLILAQGRRDVLGKFLSTNAPQIKDLDKEIPELEMKLQICKEQSEEQLNRRVHTLELQIGTLTNQIATGEKEALTVSIKLSDFEALKENNKRVQAMFDQLQANLQTLDVNKGIGQESVSILEPAGPAMPVPPEKQKHMIMAGMLGGILGFGVLLFLSLLNDRPSTFTELEQMFDLPVLGQIPLIKAKGGKLPVLHAEDERYPLVESYRSLRSALLYKDAIKGTAVNPHKTIVISSAYPSEGKSTTSTNFAVTLAQAGARVLLIDADLHRGVLHESFDAPASPGLAEVFAEKCAWAEAVVPTSIPNLWIMPRGITPRKSGNLFAKSGKFITEVSGHYDYCIFDSAPVMMSDDVLSLAPHADTLMLVIRAGFTSGRIAKAAMELLRLRRVNLSGLIFNAVPPNTGDYYNYRSKKYYQSRPEGE